MKIVPLMVLSHKDIIQMKENMIATLTRKIANIALIFQIPRLPKHGEAQKKRFRKEVIQQISKRNICLQHGHYVTEEEIDRLKKELANSTEPIRLRNYFY